MSRKSRTLRVLPGLATFRRDNSILNLSKARAAHLEFLHSKRSEILVLYPTRTARGPRDAPQSDKKVASRSYAENRPFLDQGKSQKSLNRKNAPLTIEQVRELLNKNK